MKDLLDTDGPYVIAEVGGNHGGDFETAKKYVREAADTGVDAVKFQFYQAENLIVEDEPPLPLAGDEYDSQFERFKELELDWDEWEALAEMVREFDMDFAASVFDVETADFVAENSPFIKIASGDLTNIPLLRHVVDLGKPIVLSTGFATIDEIRTVVGELPHDRLVLLHCMGSYPTADADANLRMIPRLATEFDDLPIGYSDHTIGILAPKAAVAKGARLIEKHFTLDKSLEVGDHRLSATPSEMTELVEDSKRILDMVGSDDRSSAFPCELEIRSNMRRSLATKTAVEAGDQFTTNNLTALRPERGISPLRLDEIVGATAAKDIPARTILTDDDIS